MTSPRDEAGRSESAGPEPARGELKDQYASLSSSVSEILERLDRLSKSVGELNSKLQSTSDILKWVLNALSQRSQDKEALYLKNIQASTELLKSFVDFFESKLASLEDLQTKAKEEKQTKKEKPTKEMHTLPSKEEQEFMFKPSMVRRLQEEQGKDRDKNRK